MKLLRPTLLLMLFATPWTAPYADSWGQLFTTPVQRAQLDSGQAAPVSAENSSGNAPQAPSTQPIQLTGTLTSSRGKQTVWLNGKPVTQGVRVLSAGRIQLRITSADDPRLMKSGQLLYPESGEIVEGYAAPQAAPTDTTVQTEADAADAPM